MTIPLFNENGKLQYGTLVMPCGKTIPNVVFPEYNIITGVNVSYRICQECDHFTPYGYSKYNGFCNSVKVKELE